MGKGLGVEVGNLVQATADQQVAAAEREEIGGVVDMDTRAHAAKDCGGSIDGAYPTRTDALWVKNIFPPKMAYLLTL